MGTCMSDMGHDIEARTDAVACPAVTVTTALEFGKHFMPRIPPIHAPPMNTMSMHYTACTAAKCLGRMP